MRKKTHNFVQNILSLFIMITRISSVVVALTMTFAAQAEDWMGWVENEAYISQLSIPGTHDSATGQGFTGFLGTIAGNTSALTQGKTIAEQWDCGVRAFDLRPALNGNSLEIYHGVCQTKISLAGALDVICAKLDEHPTEFAIILTRHETDGDSNNAGWADAMASLLNDEKYASHMAAYNPALTVQQMRGKFVMLSRDSFTSDKVGFVSGWSHSSDFASQQNVTARCGSASGRLFVQDFYDCTGTSADQTKVNAVTTMNDFAAQLCENASHKNTWVINHTSGYTKSASSNGNRDMAYKANTALLATLTTSDHKHAPTGIVMMDFAGVEESSGYQTNGQSLVNTIIAQNYGYGMFKNMPAGTVLTPTPTDKTTRYFHTFTSVRRGNLIVTQDLASGNLSGTATDGNGVPAASQWEIEDRNDGTFNIRNRESGKYISPDAAYNTTLSVSDQPAARGWVFKPAGTTGLYTISCGNSVQLHQTMPELENAVYNWYDPETDFPDTVDFGSIFRITRVGTASNIVLAQTLTLDITETEATEGTEFDLTATVGPDNVTNPALAWSSNNQSVATVDSNGHVKVLKAGDCYITVRTTDSSNLSASCRLRAIADPTTGITAVESDHTGSAIFDLTGRRLSAVTSSGLYIVNGRKTYIRR